MKRAEEVIELEGFKGQKFNVSLYNPDKSLAEEVSYVIRAYSALSALKKGPGFPLGMKVKLFTAELPYFKRHGKTSTFGAFVNKSPHNEGEYYLVLDERLYAGSERLAVVSHELAHIAGKFDGSHERDTQKLAIQTLTNLYGYHEKLSKPEVSKAFQQERGLTFNAGERPREEIKDALQYLIDTGKTFGVTEKDWYDAGLTPLNPTSKRGNLEQRFGIFFISTGIITFLLSATSFTGSIIGTQFLQTQPSPIISVAILIIGALLYKRSIE